MTVSIDKLFGDKLDFDIKFWVKIKDICKIEKETFVGISVFGYENKEKYSIYVLQKWFEEKHVALLLIEEEKKTMFLSKTLMHYVWS